MNLKIAPNPVSLGEAAARETARVLREAILQNGIARAVFSTGESQFTLFSALVKEDVDWKRVEMFHLDEYVGLPESHKASFRKYLKERFVGKTGIERAHYVDGTPENIERLTKELRSAPIDIGLIGVGRNAHIAFNDPPADFDTRAAYIVVNLNEDCKRQQVAEGWFPDIASVPAQAVSMTPYQILQCKRILSVVPYAEKAEAIRLTLESEQTNLVPATLLKSHPFFTLYADEDSISLTDLAKLSMPEGASARIERIGR